MMIVVIHIGGGVVQSVQADEPDDLQVILHDTDAEDVADHPTGWFPVEKIDEESLGALVDAADLGEAPTL